ncbi:unnamed protein product [Schistosoma guineensis]|nr:unnamed protein product [Schistosoma guineensis]
MTIPSGQLQILLDRYRESQLKVLDYMRTRLLNLPCFGDVKEVDELISHLHTELENDCRTYEDENKSLYESLMISSANEAVAHNPSSDPEVPNSEACPVVGSNPTVPETCEVSNLQEEPLVPENVSRASNNGQKSNTNFKDAVYIGDLLPTDGVLKRSGEYVAQESNLNDLMSGVANPHLVSFSEPSTQCAKYALNRIRLIVDWVYEDPTLFRGGGRTQKILKCRYELHIVRKRGGVRIVGKRDQ